MALDWLKLGKYHRSKFGRWLDREGITQSELRNKAKVGQGTISRLCNDDSYTPKYETITKIKKALRKIGVEPPDDSYFGM